MTDPTAAIIHQQIVLRVIGQPDVKNMYGSGHIRPTEITLRYTPNGMRAHVHGRWVREDGQTTNAPCSNDYAAHESDTSEWPGWLADLAATWQPAAPVLVTSDPAESAALLRVVARWAASSEGRDVLVEELADAGYRLPHACGNCEGIDPDTCLMNPDRTTAGARQGEEA